MLRLAVLLALAALAGCGGGQPDVAVLMPDHRSEGRWDDEGERLADAFAAAGLRARVANAEGDAATQEEQAGDAIADGARVLVLVALDQEVGARIVAIARRRGVRVVQYERPYARGADAYVGFDYRAGGRLMAQQLLRCMRGDRVAILDGPAGDRAADQIRRGYDAALRAAGVDVVGRRSVPDWDVEQAQALFELMLGPRGRVDGVLAADDGLAEAAIRVVEARGLGAAVVGQGATEEGIGNVRAGRQCLTLRHPVDAAVRAVVSSVRRLLRGGRAPDVLVPPQPVR